MEYFDICYDASATCGSALNTHREISRLGLGRMIFKDCDPGSVKAALPVEFTIQCHRGCHSVLVVDVNENVLYIANLNKDMITAMDWSEFKPLIVRYEWSKAFSYHTPGQHNYLEEYSRGVQTAQAVER